jgi:hypothetical protein
MEAAVQNRKSNLLAAVAIRSDTARSIGQPGGLSALAIHSS